MHILTIIKFLNIIELGQVERTVDARTSRPSKMKKIIAQAVKTQNESYLSNYSPSDEIRGFFQNQY
jgi:hypothetical protein